MEPSHPIHGALEQEDPVELAKHSTVEELKRLKIAEEIIEHRYQRLKRSSRIAVASQLVVTFVAMGGLIANGFQSYMNKLQQQAQAAKDQERWNREFERAQQADKYRAFFETSALATDPNNADKRLVGYALLQEFVQDKDYNSKATLMLEESLAQELRGDTAAEGLDEPHKNAVQAILTALAHTDDCRALERAARSIEKVARRNAQSGDIAEAREVFGSYVRRLLGRAAIVCTDLKEFNGVRRPLRDTLTKNPAIVAAKGALSPTAANQKLAEILRDRCQDDLSVNGASDCGEVYLSYIRLCHPAAHRRTSAEDTAGCAEMIPVAQEVLPRFQKQCEVPASELHDEGAKKDEAALCKLVQVVAPLLGQPATPAQPPPH